MATNLTDQQITEFNLSFSGASDRIKGLISLGEYSGGSLGFFSKLKLKKAIKDLEFCLTLVPEHWQSMLFLGKIYQRLGKHETALIFLEEAMNIEKTSHVLPQEASLECIHLNNIEKALVYSEEATKRNPGNPVLLGNHSMNLIIAKRDKEALETIDHALKVNPQDQFNRKLKMIISEVMDGKRARPTCKNVFS